MSGKIEKFNQDPHCLKCGGPDVALFYRSKMLTTHRGGTYPAGTSEEHVEIKCQDCRYIFAMAPKYPDMITDVVPEEEIEP